MTIDAKPPLGKYYEVGGRQLLLHQSGRGSPPVVFLAGAGTVGLDYLNVQRLAAEITTSVVYDRAGTGWSDRVELPRTSTQVTDELRALLTAADVPGPYILAGHSLGGLYARHFAQRFPDEVAGLLLLDPAHEDWDKYMPRPPGEKRTARGPDRPRSDTDTSTGSPLNSAKKHLYRMLGRAVAGAVRTALGRWLLLRLSAVQRIRELYRSLFAQEMTDWPEAIRELLIERHVSPIWLWTGVQESLNIDELYNEVRHAGPPPDVPLIVLCSMEVDPFRRAVSEGTSESRLREEIDGKRRLYDALVGSVPHGENRLVDAGHLTIHYRHPGAVLQAMKYLLGSARQR